MTPEQEANLEAPADGLVTRVCHEFAVNEATAIELVAFIANELGAGRKNIDDLRATINRVRLVLHVLVSYQQSQSANAGIPAALGLTAAQSDGVLKLLEANSREIRFSTKAACLVLGFSTVAGAQDIAELARKQGIQKQTMNKCVDRFAKLTELNGVPGQRGKEARANMTAARKKQLKPNET